MKKSDTKTLVAALRILAEEIYCEDGIATAAIAEAADRLEELEKDLFDVNMQKFILTDEVSFWMNYADKLVEHKDMVCLPKDLENLRSANSQFATENHILKEQMRTLESTKNKITWT